MPLAVGREKNGTRGTELRAERIVMRFVGRIVSIDVGYVSERTLSVNTRISGAVKTDARWIEIIPHQQTGCGEIAAVWTS